jgi:hypothetical protein
MSMYPSPIPPMIWILVKLYVREVKKCMKNFGRNLGGQNG